MPQHTELVITKILNAPKELVFKTWTEAEHLSKWWGPKGMSLAVEQLDLIPGGIFHYSMGTPDGQKMFGRSVYKEIQAPDKLVFINSFADAKAAIMRHPLAPTWPLEVHNTLTLTEEDGITTLILKGHPINATEEEMKTFSDFRPAVEQGFAGTFEQLTAYLEQLTN
jgi:uncharacterized protein YndB with AHSA1/START domain